MRKATLFLLFGSVLGATEVTTYYDINSFKTAAGNPPFTVETFPNELISTGLTITSCHYSPGGTCSSISEGNGSTAGNGAILNHQWVDAVGDAPLNNQTGANGQYMETLFTIPTGSKSIGFDINVPTTAGVHNGQNSAFQVIILMDNPVDNMYLYPFGGGSILTGQPSNAYNGFVGFTSDEDIRGFEIDTGDVTSEISSIAYDPPAESAVPEPTSLSIAGLGLGLGLIGWRKWWRA